MTYKLDRPKADILNSISTKDPEKAVTVSKAITWTQKTITAYFQKFHAQPLETIFVYRIFSQAQARDFT